MSIDNSDRVMIERMLARPVTDATKAGWGFTNRTNFVTLEAGQRVVLQRYRHRRDAGYRLQVMATLRAPAAEAGIAIPRIREAGLDGDPAWVIFDALPGIPVPEAGDAGLKGHGRRIPGPPRR